MHFSIKKIFKKRIFFLTTVILFLFLIFPNLSTAKQSSTQIKNIDYLFAQLTIIKERLLVIQQQLQLFLNIQTKSSHLLFQSSKITQKKQKQFRTINSLKDIPRVSDDEMIISPYGTNNSEEYQIAFMKKLSKVSFTTEEFTSLTKTKEGRPLTLEELVDKMILGNENEQTKVSIIAWKNLDEKSLKTLKEIEVNKKTLSLHRSVIAWYKYHYLFAEKLSEGHMSKKELSSIYSLYKKNAKKYSPGATHFFSTKKFSTRNFKKSFFSFLTPNIARATGLVYDFGGKISIGPGLICTSGMTITVRTFPTQAPVILWIYSPILAANPFLYKNLTTGAYVIGKATWGPGLCSYTGVLDPPTPHGIASILFFGSSAF